MHAELIWIKAVSFCTCLSSVAWGRYQVVYFNHLGISPSAIGVLRAAGLGAKFFATPLWGAWQDVHGQSTLPTVACVVLTSFLLELYRSPVVTRSLQLLFLVKMSRSAANGLGTLVDCLSLRVIERHPGAGYGAQRLWTGIAWGCGSYVVGGIIDARGYDAAFWWTYGFSGLVLAMLFLRPAAGGKDEEGSARAAGSGAPKVSGNLRSYWLSVGHDSDLRPFLVLMCLYGVAMSLVEALLFLQMAREFDSTKSLMGLVTRVPASNAHAEVRESFAGKRGTSLVVLRRLVGTVTEYPFFLKSDSLIKRYLSRVESLVPESILATRDDDRYGHIQMLKVAHCCMFLRLLGLASVTKATSYVMLPALQLLHGPCFALAWTAAVNFAGDVSTRELRATSQSVLSTTYYVLGAGVGSVLWSFVYEHAGSRTTYTLGAALVATSGSVLLPKLKCRRELPTSTSAP